MSDQKTSVLKLTADGATEQRILDYLKDNASAVLVEKINAGEKTLYGALKYAKSEARKLAEGDCVCVDDATVFGWIIHFFEEDEIDEPKVQARCTVRTPSGVKKAVKPAKAAKPVDPKPEKPKGPIFLELFTNEEMGVTR